MATTTLTATSTKLAHPPSKLVHRQKSNSADPKYAANDPVGNVKSLYAPAARAFVRKDLALTQTLLEAAFATLNQHPPPATVSHDPMASLRRKWDVLRITLETTVYTSFDSSANGSSSSELSVQPDAIPQSLAPILSLPASALLDSLLDRSLTLWTPENGTKSPAYLPVPIITALVFAALKIDCAEKGRNLIETWLAQRGDAAALPDTVPAHLIDLTMEGYEKVLEVYCLQVLPRLSEWEYAMEFLKYEPDLTLEKRKQIYTSLKTLHTQIMNPPAAPSVRISRSSSSSSSSSLLSSPSPSSSSSGTATPNHPHPIETSNVEPKRAGSALSTSSFSSQSSQQTVRASQYPSTSSPHPAANGNVSLAAPSFSTTTSKSRSRSPQSRKEGRSISRSPRASADGHASPSHAANSDRTTTKPRSNTGSSRTALPLVVPPPPTTSTSTSGPLSASTPTSRNASHFSVLREWAYRTIAGSGRGSERGTRALMILVTVLVPLIAYIARLRTRVPRPAVGRSGRLLVAPTQRNAGMIRWLFEAVRDSVVMAGKGLV